MNLAKHVIDSQNSIITEDLKKRRCESDCKEHLFSLVQDNKDRHNMEVAISFCPKVFRGSQPPESTHPEFNLDGVYYTSAFQLGMDRK